MSSTCSISIHLSLLERAKKPSTYYMFVNYVCFFFHPLAAAATASSIKAINSTEANLDKLPNEFVKLPENLFRSNQKPCKNLSVDEYLLAKAHTRKIVNIDHLLRANATTFKLDMPANSSSPLNYVPISIDVKHDLFDANYGLVRNVFYTGMLLLAFRISIPVQCI